MSYTYLQEQGEVSSAESFSDIPAYVLSRLNLTADKCSCNGSETESCPGSPSGTTCEHLTDAPGKDLLMSCAVGSLVRTLVLQGKGQELQEIKADSGEKWPEWFSKFDQDLYLWKTRQCSLLEGLDEFSETWPKWGMMQDGESSEQTQLDFHIVEQDCGWLPTPSGTSNHGKNHIAGAIEEWGGSWNTLRGTVIGKRKSVELEELLLGYPVGWTGLIPLETVKFQQWLSLHGKPSHNNPQPERTGQ